MNDDRRLRDLMRSVLSSANTDDGQPTHDLWPAIERRINARPSWTGLDLALLVFVALLLGIFPNWLVLLALHL